MSKKKAKRSLFSTLRNNFIAGIVVLIPIGITLYLTLFIIKISSKILPKEINPNYYLPYNIPGLEILISVFIISGITFLILKFPSVAAAATKYVPASILSNITEYLISCVFFTPLILIVRFDNHFKSHPNLIKKFVKSFISGSIAQFFNIVVPLANVAAIIKFSVAPTEIF